MLSLAEWRDEYLVARTGSRSWIQGSVWSRCWRKRSESRTYVIAFVNDLKVLKKFQPFSLKGLFGPAATVAIRWSKNRKIGSGCKPVGRAVASDTRGLQFESSHRQKFIYIEHLFTVKCVLKRWKLKKRSREWPTLFNISLNMVACFSILKDYPRPFRSLRTFLSE